MVAPVIYQTKRNTFQETRRRHWEVVSGQSKTIGLMKRLYDQRLGQMFAFAVGSRKRVLEIGCGTGNLLASLQPDVGIGIDFSQSMVTQARLAHPHLQFVHANAENLAETFAKTPLLADSIRDAPFDFILLPDVLNDVWDAQTLLSQVRMFCSPNTRVVITAYSRVWEWPHNLATKLGAATPRLLQNWLTVPDLSGMLHLEGFETISTRKEFLFPFQIPILEPLVNRYLARLWPFRQLTATNFIVARPIGFDRKELKVTVVVPARNEAGNIRNIIERVPQMGAGTELIFVEGNSTDDTWATIQTESTSRPELGIRVFQQKGKGKGDAVRLGFEQATGDVLMILDADLTVPPEMLPRFYEAIVSGRGEFINGVRLVYPMESEAMRPLNFIGNKFFSWAFSWLLGQPIKDTLCGTKVLSTKAYAAVATDRAYFGDFDPFGDFDLLFGAAKQNLKIVEVPVRYEARTYGDTNIERWKHGVILLRMVVFAARRIRFL